MGYNPKDSRAYDRHGEPNIKKKYPDDGGLKVHVHEYESTAASSIVECRKPKTEKFDLLVFIGRFSPFHNGHKRVIEEALKKASNVLVLVGSAGKARTVRNPFTYEERAQMIFESFPTSDRIITSPLYDKTYNDTAWIKQVQDTVHHIALNLKNRGGFRTHGLADIKIGLIGADKDHTSYYLKLFPQWESVGVPVFDMIHATSIREGIIDGKFERFQLEDNLLPKPVSDFFFNEKTGFVHTETFQQIKRELQFVRDYKKAWAAAPYPVKHVTCDAVVEQSGHILLVNRRAEPGKGLWAMPGGHLNEYEKVIDGIIRELREETKIKVPDAVLRGSIVKQGVFDDPHRSMIGRVITHAAHIKLADDVKLAKVRGADDAEKAQWVPIGDLREDQLFDDHYHVICSLLGIG